MRAVAAAPRPRRARARRRHRAHRRGTADLYPRFTLTGSVGLRSEDVKDLHRRPLQLRRDRSQHHLADLRRRPHRLQHRRAERAHRGGAGALRADAAAGARAGRERAGALRPRAGAAQRAARGLRRQSRGGGAGAPPARQRPRSSFSTCWWPSARCSNRRTDWWRARRPCRRSLVTLYVALGGGWEAAEAEAAGGAMKRPRC